MGGGQPSYTHKNQHTLQMHRHMWFHTHAHTHTHILAEAYAQHDTYYNLPRVAGGGGLEAEHKHRKNTLSASGCHPPPPTCAPGAGANLPIGHKAREGICFFVCRCAFFLKVHLKSCCAMDMP